VGHVGARDRRRSSQASAITGAESEVHKWIRAFSFLFLLCLAKTSYTYKMNDLLQSSSSLGLFR
jgi:hypothetical protein